MKKNLKAVLALLAAGVMAGALVGCGDQPTPDPTPDPTPTVKTTFGIGYGMVHGAGYVAKATVAMNDGKYDEIAWDEACLPTYIVAPEATDDTVTTTVISHGSEVEKIFYKTVKFADVTMTYDLEKNTYVVGEQTMVEFFQNEANAKKYFEAVFAGRVAVVVNGADDYTVMTPGKLLKSRNEYWDNIGASGLGYWQNYANTISYIKANGLAAAKTLDPDNKDGKVWVDGNGVSTGATWTDLATTKENSLSYVELVERATNNAVTATYASGYGMVHAAGYVAKVNVAAVDGTLVDIAWDEACLPTYVVAPEATDDTVTTTVISHGSEVEKIFYKTVKFADVTMTYDLEKNTYVVGNQTMVEFFQTEANAAKYYEAVATSSVAVVINGADDTSVLNAKALLKTRNGYWNRPAVSSGLGYAINYGRTVEYILANGLDAAKALDPDNKDGKVWVDGNGVSTGATWTDLATTKENSLSYVALVELAASKL
ncbi:MAG: hypothetical protein J5993_04135 [Clostridia bacterium]|nr:hypothetical protein [Clostridia bacterium]